MADEVTYYSDATSHVYVTDKRLMVDSTTYSMANITSVSTKVVARSRAGYVVLGAIGLILAIVALSHWAFPGVFFGGFLAAVSYFGYLGTKPEWHLCVVSASGEATPMHSRDQAKIRNIANAMNEAIVHRA